MESNGLFTEDEIEVLEILIGFEETHKQTWYFKWGRRAKRTALKEASPPPPPSKKPTVGDPSEKPADRHSPVSPLEFAGVSAASGEKDDNPKPTKIPRTTAKKDCAAEKIGELTKTKKALRGEIGSVRDHRKKLMPHNSESKATKAEVLSKKEEPQTVVGVNFALELSQYYQTPMVIPPNHRQPYIPDPTARSFPFVNGPQAQFSSGHELGSSSSVGPLGFDLNLFPEEYSASAADAEQPRPCDEMMEIEDRRARSADARRRRRGLMKIKNMRSACGIKLPADE